MFAIHCGLSASIRKTRISTNTSSPVYTYINWEFLIKKKINFLYLKFEYLIIDNECYFLYQELKNYFLKLKK